MSISKRILGNRVNEDWVDVTGSDAYWGAEGNVYENGVNNVLFTIDQNGINISDFRSGSDSYGETFGKGSSNPREEADRIISEFKSGTSLESLISKYGFM